MSDDYISRFQISSVYFISNRKAEMKLAILTFLYYREVVKNSNGVHLFLLGSPEHFNAQIVLLII